MMLGLRKSGLVALLVLLGGIPSYADTFLFAILTNSQENPPAIPTTSTGAPRAESFGFATFRLNDAMTAMTFSATVFNIDFTPSQTPSQTPDINDNLTAAHIHAGPAVTPTTNGPVVWGFIGLPFNDNNPNDVVVQPFATGVGGTVSGKWDLAEGQNTNLAAQLPNILAGRSYINFHTRQFGGGEVRGAIVLARRCPFPQGSWRNNRDAWPVVSLTLGSQTYTREELLFILNTTVGGRGGADASLILAHQLIAAKLNIANGSDPTSIINLITHADAILAGFSGKVPFDVAPSSPGGQQMTSDADALASYNNGVLTPGCLN
jgi:hypothetical protein